jgi:3-oxoacyl-[acyl-carrier protein] reductase
MFTFHHRRAIVTGAASGIGRAAARVLQEAGVAVIGLDIAGAADEAVPLLRVDLSDESQIVEAVAGAAGTLGGLDLLVNAAGILIDGPIRELRAQDIDRLYAVNVRGLMLTTREALRHMPTSGTDALRIINVASELAFLGRANASAYSATKAAVLGLTRAWARELAPLGLVNAVAPGPIDTPLLDFAAMSEAQRAVECDNPLRRIGTPAEVAGVIAFLASSGARYVTGQCYSADGGAALH